MAGTPSVFAREHDLLEQSEAVLQNGRLDAESFQNLLQGYESLLRKSEKIVRLGDSAQQKLMRARQMQELAISRYQSLVSQKNDVMGMIAHDLKNRIAPVVSASAQLKEDGLDSEDAAVMLDIICDSANEMLKAMEETLQRRTGPGESIEPVIDTVNLSRLVENTVTQYGRLAQGKAQTIVPEIEENVLAELDAFLFSEVMDNLLSNALKYSPKGKTIWVKLHATREDFTLTVRDEGLGMTVADLERVFQAQTKLSARPTDGETSSGVGLSIVKRLVELHHGVVTAQSEGKDRGTTFTVRAPRAQPHTA